MRYALLLYAAPGARPADAEARLTATGGETREPAEGESGQPAEGGYPNWVDYTRALKKAVPVLGAERLREVGSATTLRRRDGRRVLTDGPFAETKEHLLGLYLIDAPDLDTALDWAEQMPFVEWGTVEVRPVVEDLPFRAVLDE